MSRDGLQEVTNRYVNNNTTGPFGVKGSIKSRRKNDVVRDRPVEDILYQDAIRR
jgi:hypothetical protein